MSQLPSPDSDRYAVIKPRSSGKKSILWGIVLCALLIFTIFYILSQKVVSTEASIEGAKEVIYSPVPGKIFELPKKQGDLLKKGDALLRFDPMLIRRQNSDIREYLNYFQRNRHNPGLLRSKFSPIFSHIFGEYSDRRQVLENKEQEIRKKYEQKTLEHAKIKVQLNDPTKKRSDGRPDPNLASAEQAIATELDTIMKEFEMISMQRADIDRETREVTNDLGKSHGMLYIYLEEEFKRAQKLAQHEYLYATAKGRMGEIFVNQGDFVEENTALYEILPDVAEQWFVLARFSKEDATGLKERDLCSVSTEDGFEFEARIESIKPKDNFVEVRLVVINAPKGLKAQKFATVTK